MSRPRVAVVEAEDTRDEITAIRAEMREMANEVIPLAAHLWRNALIDGDPKAKAAAGRIVYFGKRLAERGGPDAA